MAALPAAKAPHARAARTRPPSTDFHGADRPRLERLTLVNLGNAGAR
jgi:hypothetical protein